MRRTFIPDESDGPAGGEASEGFLDDPDMANIRSPSYPERLRSILERETDNAWYNWELEDYRTYLVRRKRLGERTVKQRLRDLTRMAAHPVSPVKMRGSAADIVESFEAFVDYRENVEGKAATAVVNDFKAIKLLGAYLGIPEERWPTRPTVPRKARKRLPAPEQIHTLLHDTYAPNPKNSYEQALVKYLLVYDFGFAVRFPSEAHSLLLDDFDPDAHLITVREPKKSGSERTLYIEPEWLCCASNKASLAQYLPWRAKVDVGGTDRFFLKPNGEPFRSKEYLRSWLCKRVKAKHPWFEPYDGRRWGINARLIDWDFDYARVANWTGHESVDMIRRTYEHDARVHQKMYGGDWLSRAFYARKPYGERTVKVAHKAHRPAPTGVTASAPAGI